LRERKPRGREYFLRGFPHAGGPLGGKGGKFATEKGDYFLQTTDTRGGLP